MKKIFFIVAAMLATTLVFGQELINDDFSSYTEGQHANSGSNMKEIKSGGAPLRPWMASCTKVYDAGGMIKFGASNAKGSLTTTPLTVTLDSVVVTFNALGWTGTADVNTKTLTYGTQVKEFTTTPLSDFAALETELAAATFTITFAKEADAALTFAGGGNKSRFFLDNLVVSQKEVTSAGGEEIITTGIAINEEVPATVEQYREFKLTATLTPEGATDPIVWGGSENVTVTNGLVKANSLGAASVKASVTNADEETFTDVVNFTVIEPTVLTCAQAAEKALAVSGNNVLVEGGRYVVEGFITNIAFAWKSGSMSFWIADTKGTDQTFEVYKFECDEEFAAKLVEGVKVRVVAYLTKYDSTPETAQFTAEVTILPEEVTPIEPEQPEPGFKIEKLWQTGPSVIPAQGNCKQGVGYDGVIYLQDKTEESPAIYSFAKVGNDIVRTKYADSDTGQGLGIDDAGNMVCRTGYFATATPNQVLLFKKGETTPVTIDFTLPDPERCDYNSASGDFFSAEGGYVWFGCKDKTKMQYVKICNGGATPADITTGAIGDVLPAGAKFGTQNHVMTGTATSWEGQARSANFLFWKDTQYETKTLPGHKFSTLGGCKFEIQGNVFYAYNSGTKNYNSEFKIYNFTAEKDEATGLICMDATPVNTAYANWLTASKIDEYSYYIHQFCPNIGIALWKVTFVPEEGGETAVENVKVSNIFAHQGTIYNVENARIYNLNGQDVTRLNGNLNGIYIVKSAEQVVKVIVR